MVSPMNPFKKTATDLLDDQLRLEMVEKALDHEPQLKACDYEFRLPKPSYTWHTLQAISKDYPENEFTLLIGGDNWAAFDKLAPPRRHPSPLSHRGLSAPGSQHRQCA